VGSWLLGAIARRHNSGLGIVKRRAVVASVKNKPEYATMAERRAAGDERTLRIPRTPDSEDRAISKSTWEAYVESRSHFLRDGERRARNAFARQGYAAASAESAVVIGDSLDTLGAWFVIPLQNYRPLYPMALSRHRTREGR